MEQNVKKKMPGRLIIIAGILLIVAGIGIFFWIKNQSFETTDNAQVDCNIIPVRSAVTAYLKTVCFSDNESVKKGQVLFIFDSTELKARVEESEAALNIARARLLAARNKASSSMESAQAGSLTSDTYTQNVVSARANLEKAQNNLNRINALFKIKGATKEQLENAETGLSLAQAEFDKAVSSRKSSLSTFTSLKSLAKSDENQITLAEAQVSQCEAELFLARKQLSYAVVYAPAAGITSKRAVQAGQYISAGQSLCALVDNNSLWITANFKETQIQYIHIGEKTKIALDAYPDLRLTGKIESFSGATGAKYALLPPDNATGNFIKIAQRVPVKISIDPIPGQALGKLFPGLSAFVKVLKN